MWALLLASLMFAAGSTEGVRQFRPIETSTVSRTILQEGIDCPVGDFEECWKNFLATGEVRLGDVDLDGVDELLVFPGAMWAGTGGRTLFLFQKREEAWHEIAAWSAYRVRYDILPVVRDGYHDLRTEVDRCLKWTGSGYVSYGPEDYRQLSSEFFDTKNIREAEIFWKMQYGEQPLFVFQPRWFPGLPDWSVNKKLRDPEFGLEWWATFTGGVYGVRDGRSFLLLPRPSYLGAGELKLDGDWLLIYEPEDPLGPPLARYNRRTRELRIERGE